MLWDGGYDDVRDDLFRFNSETFFVINPLTGESIKLPQVNGDEDYVCRGGHGFGSTVDGDYYKILRIIETYDGFNVENRSDLTILTFGVDDEWRNLDVPAILGFDSFTTTGVALNGALHWVGFNLDSYLISIYAFHVGKEIGCCIPCPSSDSPIGDLGVWDGHLCYVQGDENEFRVWTMRQYGVADSWTKDIILRGSILSYYHAIPITTRRSRALLLSIVDYGSRKSFISFDPKTKNCVKLDEIYDDKDTASDLLEYAPCFSSFSGIMSKQITIRDS